MKVNNDRVDLFFERTGELYLYLNETLRLKETKNKTLLFFDVGDLYWINISRNVAHRRNTVFFLVKNNDLVCFPVEEALSRGSLTPYQVLKRNIRSFCLSRKGLVTVTCEDLIENGRGNSWMSEKEMLVTAIASTREDKDFTVVSLFKRPKIVVILFDNRLRKLSSVELIKQSGEDELQYIQAIKIFSRKRTTHVLLQEERSYVGIVMIYRRKLFMSGYKRVHKTCKLLSS